MISGGALWELVRISRDCSRDDIRSILSLLESEDPNICMHAVKVVANLAAEGDCFSLQTLFISLFSDIHSS